MLHPKWLLALTLGTALACKPDVEPDPDPVPGPLFAVSTQVFSPDGETTFITLVPSLNEGEVDLTDAIEIPGRGLVTGPENQDVLFVVDGESPEITRFELTPDAQFQAKETVSFAGVGISSLLAFPGQFQFFSDTKAYFLDNENAQIVVWNPSDMTITKTVSLLDGLDIPNAVLTFEIEPTRRGNELIAAVAYFIGDGNEILPETRVVFINTENEEFEVVSFQGCGDIQNSVTAANGDIYLSTEGFGVAVHRVLGEAAAPAPCLLRIPAGTRTLENALPGSLNDLFGAPTGSIVQGNEGSAFVLSLDESLVTPESLQDPLTLRGNPFWRFQEIDLDTLTPGDFVDEIPPGTASTLTFQSDGRNFLLQIAADFSATTLVEMNADSFELGLSMPGVPFGIIRVR